MNQPATPFDAHMTLPPPLTCAELAARIAPLHDAFDHPPILIEDVIEHAIVEAASVRRVIRRGMALATVRADADRLQHVLTALIDDVIGTTSYVGACARSITVRTEIVAAGKVIVEIADLRRLGTRPPAREEIVSRASDAFSGVVARAAAHFSLGRAVWLDLPRP